MFFLLIFFSQHCTTEYQHIFHSGPMYETARDWKIRTPVRSVRTRPAARDRSLGDGGGGFSDDSRSDDGEEVFGIDEFPPESEDSNDDHDRDDDDDDGGDKNDDDHRNDKNDEEERSNRRNGGEKIGRKGHGGALLRGMAPPDQTPPPAAQRGRMTLLAASPSERPPAAAAPAVAAAARTAGLHAVYVVPKVRAAAAAAALAAAPPSHQQQQQPQEPSAVLSAPKSLLRRSAAVADRMARLFAVDGQAALLRACDDSEDAAGHGGAAEADQPPISPVRGGGGFVPVFVGGSLGASGSLHHAGGSLLGGSGGGSGGGGSDEDDALAGMRRSRSAADFSADMAVGLQQLQHAISELQREQLRLRVAVKRLAAAGADGDGGGGAGIAADDDGASGVASGSFFSLLSPYRRKLCVGATLFVGFAVFGAAVEQRFRRDRSRVLQNLMVPSALRRTVAAGSGGALIAGGSAMAGLGSVGHGGLAGVAHSAGLGAGVIDFEGGAGAGGGLVSSIGRGLAGLLGPGAGDSNMFDVSMSGLLYDAVLDAATASWPLLLGSYLLSRRPLATRLLGSLVAAGASLQYMAREGFESSWVAVLALCANLFELAIMCRVMWARLVRDSGNAEPSRGAAATMTRSGSFQSFRTF
jgi:hypothetical protein